MFVTLVGAIETIGDAIAIQRVSWRQPRAVDFRALQGGRWQRTEWGSPTIGFDDYHLVLENLIRISFQLFAARLKFHA